MLRDLGHTGWTGRTREELKVKGGYMVKFICRKPTLTILWKNCLGGDRKTDVATVKYDEQ